MRKLFACIFMLFSLSAFATPNTITINGNAYTFCGDENANCTWSGGGTRSVVFGFFSDNGQTSGYAITASPVSSGGGCFVGGLFNSDPASGFDKSCWSRSGGIPPPAPTVTLTAAPNPITVGASSTLSWSSTNATACSGVGTGTSGSASISPASTTTYTETCTGTGGSGSKSVTVTVNPVIPPPSGLSCTAGSVTTGPAGSALIEAEASSADGTKVYNYAAAIRIDVTTRATTAQNFNWTIKDARDATLASGTFSVATGSRVRQLNCTSTVAGFFKFNGSLSSSGGSVAAKGTRQSGATFGVLPALSSILPSVSITPDQHRFGMQGFNSNYAALKVLGVTDVIDDGNQINLAPTCMPYTPALGHLNPFFSAHPDITRIVRLDGYPACNSVTGMPDDSYHLPANQSQWSTFVGAVAQETEMIRASNYPSQAKNYYQVTWEPSLAGTFLGGSGAADFAALYQLAYTAVHARDPNAVVMGPGEPFADNNGYASGNRIATTPGLCSYLDGVTTHAYYNAPTVPSNPPELQDFQAGAEANSLPNEMKGLRAKMQACKPNMKLFNTELGISYDSGVSYASVTPNHLWAQAAVTTRAHIIVLGEGAQRTYFFFGPDMPEGLSGYGTFYDLVQSPPQFGDSVISPKPVSISLAVLTRVVDGTRTLGRVAGTGTGVYAYAFQQLPSGRVITAAWSHNPSSWVGPNSFSQTNTTTQQIDVDAAGNSGNVSVIDWMGNVSSVPYSNGKVTVTLSAQPIYIVSNNPAVAAAHVTAPIGYIGQ